MRGGALRQAHRAWRPHAAQVLGDRRLLSKQAGDGIAIDRSKMYSIKQQTELKHGAASSMMVHLTQRIKLRSPLTIAEYMRECLTNAQHGYYMKKDVFGSQGDFTTAPEISQMFGECIAIWVLHTYAAMAVGSQKQPKNFRLVELGPGRGTFMSDIVRTIKQLAPEVLKMMEVDLVEVSPSLKKLQEDKLAEHITSGLSVRWQSSLKQVPAPGESAIIYLAQEFFDALAVHQFVKKDVGWCEYLVDVGSKAESSSLHYVVSRGPTVAATLYEQYLPTNVDEAEICPEGIGLAETLGSMIAETDGLGAALIVDYGREGPIKKSLRAIRDHKMEPALENPGDADLSVDVDFRMLADAAHRGAKRTQGGDVKIYGPTPQSRLLSSLGIRQRMLNILETQRGLTKEQRQDILKAYERLIGPEQMGEIYKALAIAHPRIPKLVAFD
mmetsp:Transcript_3866/g.11543  ORF Transcript_3866/g.11543 Transcript_3866/m.11543 type:complete len:441 (-) Transcript_3866:1084-2406(-)